MGKILNIVLLVLLAVLCRAYELPPAKLEALRPYGLKVTLPDDGFSRIIFQGILNEETEGSNSHRWLGVVSKHNNGTWEYNDSRTELKYNDKIYYKIDVAKDGKTYVQDGEFIVDDFTYTYREPAYTVRPTPALNAPCPVSRTAVDGYTYTCIGELLFSEDFDKSSIPDLKDWHPEVKFPEQPDYLFNVYQAEGPLEMKSGSLVVTPIALNEIVDVLDLTGQCTGQAGTRQCKQESSGALIVPPIITGKITTKYSFNFKFGRIEISAKMPVGHWIIPELTLEPTNSVYGTERYASGLMRVAYTRGIPAMGKKLYGGPILSDEDPYRSYFIRETVGDEEWSKNFHNYTLLWKPDGLELFVDGERYGTVSPGFSNSGKEYQVTHADGWKMKTSMAPLDEYFYLSLGLRVGGVHDFPDSPEKPWINKSRKAMLEFWNNRTSWLPTWDCSNLMVDYVRVYAL